MSGSLGVDLGLWLRDKQHELGIQMQWACWEGLIVCAPRHPLMAELAHHVIHPATSGAGVGRSLRERLQHEICRFDPERLSPGWHISKAYGYVYLVDLAEFRSHGLATTTWRSAESPAAGAGLARWTQLRFPCSGRSPERGLVRRES